MRCPKCSYISFDKVTSCVKCSADVTDTAQALNGTAFKSLGTFFLGSLIPDYAAGIQGEEIGQDFAFDSGAEDLDISMDAIDDFGEVPDLPGDIDEEDITLAGTDISEFEGEDISLDGHEVPDIDMDLAGFDEEAGAEEQVEDVGFDDVPDFDLSGIELEEEGDLDMASDEEETMTAAPDLSDIDLSLGEEELDAGDESEEGLDLADLEIEGQDKKKENSASELPDLEL